LSRYQPAGYKETRLPEGGRVAQILHVCEDRKQYNIVNTHLHHLPKDDECIRFKQIKFLLDWMSKMAFKSPAWILAGDFNALPKSKTIQHILKKFDSAYLSFHGTEPEYTFPTLLVEEKGDWNMPRTIDYIFFSPTTITVEEAHLAFTQADPNDPTLFASDHYGLVATFS
jgi:endonuclease/exonuclease/phosphatase family metal-dependent hydrolase